MLMLAQFLNWGEEELEVDNIKVIRSTVSASSWLINSN